MTLVVEFRVGTRLLLYAVPFSWPLSLVYQSNGQIPLPPKLFPPKLFLAQGTKGELLRGDTLDIPDKFLLWYIVAECAREYKCSPSA